MLTLESRGNLMAKIKLVAPINGEDVIANVDNNAPISAKEAKKIEGVWPDLPDYTSPTLDDDSISIKRIEVNPHQTALQINNADFRINPLRVDVSETLVEDLRQTAEQKFKTKDYLIRINWEQPTCLIFGKPTNDTTTDNGNTAPVPVPSNKKRSKADKDSNEEEINSPLSTSAYSLNNQRRLIQRQQQALNDEDNKHKQDNPDKQQPIVDDTLQRQRQLQAVQQQVNAVADENDEDNYKPKLIPTGTGDPKVLAHFHELSKKRQLRNNIKRQLRNKQYLAQEEATQPHLHITKANPQQTHPKESDGPSM